MAEIAFEYMLLALEGAGARGTPIDPPTHYLNMAGTVKPNHSKYRPDESLGVLAEYSRGKTVRRWSEWEGEGGADTYVMPLLLHMLLDGSVAPTTPGGAVASRLWTFNPTLTSDDIRSATVYFGDPNVNIFQAPFCMVDEFTLAADASSEDGVTCSVSGMGWFPNNQAPASIPARITGPLLAPGNMQLWLDTTSPIGTTEITGRFVSGEFSMSSALSYKWLAVGPTGALNFTRTGRGKRHGELNLVFEFLDLAQYNLFADNNGDTVARARWRINGPVIEGAFRHYINIDMTGTFESAEWGELEGTNRTLELTMFSEYNATAGYDFNISVQNDRATL